LSINPIRPAQRRTTYSDTKAIIPATIAASIANPSAGNLSTDFRL
jgi:hypothetical protein